ncbi:MAG: hypothetical protein AAGC55_04685 [Myxococcota bacterium]
MARNIAARYGKREADLIAQIETGRCLIRSDVDRETANQLVIDLRALGAVCLVLDHTGNAIDLNRPGFAPASASGRPGSHDGGPAAYQSGLAAAQADQGNLDLVILSNDSGSLSLAMLDGEEDQERAPAAVSRPVTDPGAFAPPGSSGRPGDDGALQLAVVPERQRPPSHGEPAGDSGDGLGPVVTGVAMPSGLEQTNAPLEMDQLAAPPSAVGSATTRRATTQRPAQRSPSVAGGTRATGPLDVPLSVLNRGLATVAGQPRARYAVGVLLAVVLGFLPAHIVSSIREGTYDDIDQAVIAEQERVETVEEWQALDDFRAAQLERKESAQSSIALTGMLVWLLAGGGIGFLWFRKIDWDTLRLTS